MEEFQFNVKQESQRKNKDKGLLIGIISFCIILIISMVIVLVGIGDDESGSRKSKIEITNARIEVEYSEYLGYSAVIKGVATNITNTKFSYVSIEYAVYDSSGNNLGTAYDNISNLYSGDTWQFECNLFYYGDKKPVSFKLVEIITW